VKLAQAFPSKYLNAADIKFPRVVTIAGLRQEEVGQDKQLKWVLYFQNEPKPLVLNKTVWAQVEFITGCEDTDQWPGRDIELFSDLVRNPQGQLVPGVRARVRTLPQFPQGTVPQPPQQPQFPQGGAPHYLQQSPAMTPPQQPPFPAAAPPQFPQPVMAQRTTPVAPPTPPWSPEAEPIPDPGDPMTAQQRAAAQPAKVPF
jgi:hypothetical protein